MQKRGHKRGQYVMARRKDKGPYAAWNVECITHQQNSRDQVKNGTSSCGERSGRAKLTERQVIEIFHSTDSNITLGKRFGVTEWRIRSIKRRITWTKVTKNL